MHDGTSLGKPGIPVFSGDGREQMQYFEEILDKTRKGSIRHLIFGIMHVIRNCMHQFCIIIFLLDEEFKRK